MNDFLRFVKLTLKKTSLSNTRNSVIIPVSALEPLIVSGKYVLTEDIRFVGCGLVSDGSLLVGGHHSSHHHHP